MKYTGRVIKDHMKNEMWNNTKNKGRTDLVSLAGSKTKNILVSKLPSTEKALSLLVLALVLSHDIY